MQSTISFSSKKHGLLIASLMTVFGFGLIFTILTALESIWLGLFGVLGLSVLLVTLIQPKWMFTVIYPSFIMLGQVPLPIGETKISLERAMILLAEIGLMGGIWVTKRLPILQMPHSVLLGIVTLLGSYLASMILLPSDTGSLIVFGLFQKAALAYLVFISITETEQLYTVLKLYLVTSFIASLFSLAVFYSEGSLSLIRSGSYEIDTADFELSLISGLARMGAGNTMALWAAIMLAFQRTAKKGRLFWLCLVIWFGVFSLFALRREALITISVGLLWLIWQNPEGHRRALIFLTCLLVAILGGFVLASPEWMDRLMGETVLEFSSGTDVRTELLLRFTPTAFMASPLIGYGPGNYQAAQFFFPETVTPFMLELGGIGAHNSWSGTAIEAGVGALIGFCILLFGIGRPLFTPLRIRNPKLSTLWNLAPLLFIQLLFSLFFGDGLKASLIWFWFGFLLALERLSKRAADCADNSFRLPGMKKW